MAEVKPKTETTPSKCDIDTELQCPDESLQHLEPLVRTLLESETEIISLQDTDHNILRISKAAELAFGRQIIGQKCYQVYQGCRDVCPGCPALSLSDGDGGTFSSLKQAVNDRTYSVRALPLFDKDGNPCAIIEFASDVSKNQKTEDELRKAISFWDSVFNNTNDAICVINIADFTIARVNDVFLQMNNVTREQAIGKTCHEISHHSAKPCTGPEHTCPLKMAVSLGRRFSCEHTHYRNDGKPLIFRVSCSPIQVDDQRMTQVVHVQRDVTDRREAEKALLTSEENFRNSIDNSPVGIRILSADGDTLYANQSLLAIYGYKNLEEMMETPQYNYYTPESYAEYLVRKEQRKTGAPVPDIYEVSIVRKDGKPRHLRVNSRKVLWAGKTEYQAIYEDVTEYRQMKETLTNLSRRLIEIQEEERRILARELHDEIGQSLNVINLMLKRVIRKDETANDPLLNDAHTQIVSLISRISNMSLDLRPMMLDDLGLLDTIVWYLGRYTSLTNVQVDFKHFGLGREISQEVVTTAYRVLQEALTNVARHAKTDHAKVDIWADHSRLSLHVEDNGVGFDMSRFDNAHSSGLNGMRERVNLLNGKFSIDSTPGSGTRVSAEIPLSGNIIADEGA